MAKEKKRAKKSAKPGVEVKEPKYAVPQTIEQAAELLATLGMLSHEAKKEADKIDEIVALAREAGETILRPLRDDIKLCFDGLKAYANANRDKLTNGGKKKSVKLSTGTLRWHMKPPKVDIENPEAVTKLLKEMGLEDWVRTKSEPDKAAMRKDAEKAASIEGVTVTQSEEFKVKPESGTGELNEAAISDLTKAPS